MANQQLPGNYTNIQKIISANQGNQLGQTVQSGVQKGVSGLQNATNQASQSFNTDVNNANLQNQANALGPNYVQNTINSTLSANTPTTPSNSAIAQPNNTNGTALSQQTNQSGGTTSTPAASTQAQSSSNAAITPVSFQNAPATAPAGGSNAGASTSNSNQNISNLPGSFGYASNATSGANQTTTTAPNAGAVANFANFLQGGYSGPQQLQNYGTLAAQASNLQNIGKNVTTPGGLQNLLQQYVGGNNYTQGEQNLDSIILGQTGKQNLQNIAGMTQNVGNIPSQAESQAQGLASQTATANQNFAQNVQGQIAAAENPIYQAIQQNLQGLGSQNAQTAASAQNIYNLLNSAPAATTSPTDQAHIGGGTAAPSTPQQAATAALNQMQASGIVNGAQYQQIGQLITQLTNAGQNPQEALAQAFGSLPTTPTYTIQQGANANQAAQLSALNQLAGQASPFTTYGGAQAYAPSINMSALPAVAAPAPAAAAPTQYVEVYNSQNGMTSTIPLSQYGQGITGTGQIVKYL